MIIKKGATDVTTYVNLVDSAAGTPETGLTITNIDATYTRNRAAPVKNDLTALAAVDSSHADNKGIEVDATNAAGLYRIDWPDAAFATGVDKVILTVTCSGCAPAHLIVELVDNVAGELANGSITSSTFGAGAIDAAAIANGAIDAATFAADMDAEILSYLVDDATRIDASALNTLSSHDPGEAIMGATDLGTGSGLTSLATAAELAKVPKSDGTTTWNATAAAQIQSEADDALAARGVTSARMGYVDNLNVGGNVASSAEVTAIQNNTRVVIVVPDVIERPDSGTTTYRVELFLYDTAGNMEAPDSAPTIALVNQAGTDRSSRLDSTTMANVSTGRYRAVYTADAADTLEQLVWAFTVVEGGATRIIGRGSLIVDTTAVDFTSADRTKLEAVFNKLPSKTYLPGTNNSDGDIQMDEATGNFPGSVGSVANDVAGKVLGGGAGSITGAGVYAKTASGDDIQPETYTVELSVPSVIEVPDTFVFEPPYTFRVELVIRDATGAVVAPDSAPTVTLVDNAGNSLAGLTSSPMVVVSTGRYRTTLLVSSASYGQLNWLFSVVKNSITRTYPATTTVVSQISHLATQSSVDTIDDFIDTEVAAIKAKTDNLPSDPADASDVAALLATITGYIDTEVAAILAAVDTEVAAIKAVTDKYDTMIELDGAVYRFTTNALEQAPAGGGGSAPTVEEIEAHLAGIHGAGPWGSSGSGTGSNEVVITVDNGSSVALENASVTLAQAGVIKGRERTDADGDVTLNLDDGTYTVAITHANHTFAGTTLKVSGVTSKTYSMTPVTITTSPTGMTTGFLTVINQTTGLGQASVALNVELYAMSTGIDGIGGNATARTITSGANGITQIPYMFCGGSYYITLGDGPQRLDVTIAEDAGATTELPSLVGEF